MWRDLNLGVLDAAGVEAIFQELAVVALKVGLEEAAVTSRPAVKARPAPVKRMARMEGSVERAVKILERLCHMLGVC